MTEPGIARGTDDAALSLATLRTYRVLGTPPDPVFDDLVDVVAQFADTDRAAIVFHDGERFWCKARAGALPEVLDEVLPRAGSAAIRAIDGTAIGELVVFGDAPIDASSARTLDVFASLVTTLLEERRSTVGATTEPWWVVVVGADGMLRAVSPAAIGLLGRVVPATRGMPVFDLIHTEDHVVAVESLAHTAAYPGEKFPLDLRFLRADGSAKVFEILAIGRDDPAIEDIVFVVKQATKRPQSDAFVSDQARVLAKIARGAPLADTLTDLAELAERFVGFAASVMLVDDAGGALREVASSGLSADFARCLDGMVVAADSTTCGMVAHRNQAVRCADISIDPAWLAHGLDPAIVDATWTSCWATPILSSETTSAIGVLALFATSSRSPRPDEVRLADLCAGIAAVAIQRNQAESTLTHLAMHDTLTGLPNRALFLDRLTHALAQRPSATRHTAVMFLDLDRFKVINDALGHDAGDEVLVAVAQRLMSVSRPASTIARFGGDEFTVLCEGLASPRDAAAIADRLAAAFSTPLPVGGGELMMSVSIGVAIVDGETISAGALLRDADAAMYRAKERGRNRVEFFDDDMRVLAVARLELEHALQEAVGRGEFSLVYQPEFDLRTGEIVATEALLRWHHPTRGGVPPLDFIPIAEETGAIHELGEWVLTEACLQARRYLEHLDAVGSAGAGAVIGGPRFTTWANLSVVQLLQPGFVRDVERVLVTTGVPLGAIGLEVTESALMTDQDAAIDVLTALKALGIRLAIDDFGTGYSSLSYLKRLPVDVVKIDRSFVETIVGDARGRAIVHGVVRLAHAVGCQVVAEGVETDAQLHLLRELGCDLGQGFGLAMPEPATAVLPGHLVFPSR